MRSQKLLTFLAVIMALGLLMTPAVQAAVPITLTNPSAATGDMTGWTVAGSGSAGANADAASDGDGWSFWMWDETMSQSLTDTFAIGSEYTMTVDVIDRPGSDSYWDFGLYYDDAGTLVPVATTAGGPQNNGSFLEVSTAVTVAAADAWVGENIVVVLSGSGGWPSSWVDNVRLDVEAPLPQAINPYPEISATKVDPDGLTLTWDPPLVPGSYTYDVYFSPPDDPNAVFVTNVAIESYTPSPELALDSLYAWRVDTKDSGNTTLLATGSDWMFTTGGGASSPVPYDGAQKQSAGDEILLSWDPDDIPASFDVYFSTDSGNLGTPVNTTDPNLLMTVDPNTMYYWVVDTKDAGGSVVVAGDLWSFSTGEIVGHWALDDVSGTTAADSSGNGFDATVNLIDSFWTNGYDRGGIEYGVDGSNSKTVAPVLPGVTANQVSACFWYFPRDLSVDQPEPFIAGTWGIQVTDTGGQIRLFNGSADDPTTSYTGQYISSNEWVHLAVTYDVPSNTAKLYINGAEVYSTVIAEMNQKTLSDVSWGRRSRGVIDDVRLYNAVLMPQEIAELSMMANPRASNPNPDNGDTRILPDTLCQWTPGDDITSQIFQLKDDPNLAGDLLEEITLGAADSSRDPLAGVDLLLDKTYYWRILSEQDGVWTLESDMWSFTTIGAVASGPNPDNGAPDVAQNKILEWLPGAGYDSNAGDEHRLYLAAGSSGVALPGSPTAVVSSGSFDPSGADELAFNTAYVWRVDEWIGGTLHTGDVWTFTTGQPNCDPPLLADTNGDCVVNLTDFAQLAIEWLSCTLTNGDCP